LQLALLFFLQLWKKTHSISSKGLFWSCFYVGILYILFICCFMHIYTNACFDFLGKTLSLFTKIKGKLLSCFKFDHSELINELFCQMNNVFFSTTKKIRLFPNSRHILSLFFLFNFCYILFCLLFSLCCALFSFMHYFIFISCL